MARPTRHGGCGWSRLGYIGINIRIWGQCWVGVAWGHGKGVHVPLDTRHGSLTTTVQGAYLEEHHTVSLTPEDMGALRETGDT